MKYRNLSLPAFVIVGVAIGVGGLSELFPYLPSENTRYHAIISALKDQHGDRPQVVILGDSVAMNGLDGNVLRDDLDGNPVVWNLGTPGQSMIMSLLIANQLPDSTDTVILSIQSHFCARQKLEAFSDRMVACRLYGYSLTTTEAEEIKELAGDKSVAPLLAPYWKTVLDARWITKNSINVFARAQLRRDLALDKLTSELVYPAVFVNPVSERVLRQLMDQFHKPRKVEDGVVSDAVEDFLLKLNHRLRANQKSLVVLLPPEHPHQREMTEPGYYESLLSELKEIADASGFQVVDLTRMLSREEFVDQVHPTPVGARKTSGRLASALRERAIDN